MGKATDPVITEWLAGELGVNGSRLLQTADDLSVLTMASSRPDATEFPEPVLAAWRRSLFYARRIVDQSEDAFIERSLKQGHTWERIADELGHPTPEDAQRHHQHLKAELARTHPSVNDRPHRP